VTNRSPIAKQVTGVRDPSQGVRRTPWGMLLHTTGGGVTDLARRTGAKPIDVAIKTYIASQNGSNGYYWGGPAYVIDHDGTIYQVAPDDIVMAHAGGANRAAYASGSWASTVSPDTVRQWRAKWPAFAHPYQLFPGSSPNTDYVGVEMIPTGDGFGTPMRPGLRFTTAQHDAAVRLADDLAQRHGFPSGWKSTSRLLGHEDVDPIERQDAGGGWDPGRLRAAPYFDFDYVRSSSGLGKLIGPIILGATLVALGLFLARQHAGERIL
jgi:hypothetical protein